MLKRAIPVPADRLGQSVIGAMRKRVAINNEQRSTHDHLPFTRNHRLPTLRVSTIGDKRLRFWYMQISKRRSV